ncbi:MAG: acyl-CoA dehydrogenase family protein [Candidatus Methanomethylicaceae archaeon]
MEWYENQDVRMFTTTAEKYASFCQRWGKAEHIVERVDVESFNWELVSEAGRAGLLTAPLPQNVGGAGLGWITQAVIMERMSRGMASTSAIIAVHWTGICSLLTEGVKHNVENWLEEMEKHSTDDHPFLCGVAFPFMVWDESEGVFPLLTKGQNGLVLHGDFIAPLHPGICDKVVLPALTQDGNAISLWLNGSELLDFCSPIYPGSGLLEIPMCRLDITEFRVKDLQVFASGELAKLVNTRFRRALYLFLSAVQVGNAQEAISYAREYAKERFQTGRPIIAHQEVARMLEEMGMIMEASRAMVFSCAGESDFAVGEKRSQRVFSFVAEACEKICLDAVQLLGGYGYMKDYPLERRLRDSKTLQLLLGGRVSEWIGRNW